GPGHRRTPRGDRPAHQPPAPPTRPPARQEGGGVMSAEVVADISWMDDGACVGADLDLFFPQRGDNDAVAAAKAVCATCPVTSECLEYALSERVTHGIWGGTSERERRRIRSIRWRARHARGGVR